MKSFGRYAMTIVVTGALTAAIAVSVFGTPWSSRADAQPAPKSEANAAGGSGGSAAPTPPVGRAAGTSAPGSAAGSATPVGAGSGSAAGSAAPAGAAGSAAPAGAAGSAAPADAGSGSAAAKQKASVVAIDCALAPGATEVTTDAKGYRPDKLTFEAGKVIKFRMSGADDVQPYPGGEPGLVAPANATTCLRFDAAGEYKFRAKARPIEGTIVTKMWYELLAERPISEDGNFWMPKAVNVEADSTDKMFYAVLGMSAFFFFGITAAVIYLVIKYRHRPGHKAQPSSGHHDALEITWTVIPTIITVFLFYYGWRTYIQVVTPPTKAVEVNVLAWRWNWQFTHANGVQDKDLHVPVNTPVRLVMTSKDVLHAFYAPVMRVKQDIIPRRYTYAWFKATKPGTYRLTCAEYCGTDHSQMGITKEGRRAVVVVHEPGKYEQYLADEQARSMSGDPKDLGARLYDKKGCVSCHTIDGSPRVGPSFKGGWGTTVPLADGSSVLFDENYVHDSLMTPQKQLHQGFPGSMPTFEGQLKPVEIEGLTAFIKSLK